MLDMCFSFRDKWLAESQLVGALSPGNDIGLYQGYWIAVRYYFLIGGWPKTEGFVVISRSKLNQYQDDLLYVRVRISSHNVFFSSFFSCDTAKYEALSLYVLSKSARQDSLAPTTLTRVFHISLYPIQTHCVSYIYHTLGVLCNAFFGMIILRYPTGQNNIKEQVT